MISEIQQRNKDYKRAMDIIIEFLHQCKYPTDSENYYGKSFCTKDYTLHHFQCYIGRKIDDTHQKEV